MGLTHYWRRPIELPPRPFAQAVADVKRVLAAIGTPLAGNAGQGQAVFASDAIAFNGAGGHGCEPFEIHQTEFGRSGAAVVRASCKTGHAPYDVAVRATLIVLKHYLGDQIRVMSDVPDANWAEARALCEKYLGYGGDFRLDNDAFP